MKILLDYQVFYGQKYGGVSRYYTEIFSRLNSIPAVEIKTAHLFSENIYYNESNLLSKKQKAFLLFKNVLQKLGISIKSKIRRKNKRLIAKAISEKNYDLFIPTYYHPYFLELIGDKPFVLTVYDMINELFPNYFEIDKTTIKNKLLLMEKATKIIAVSINTKKDILKIYPHIDENKI
jgi:hypothetical protein